MTRVTCHVTTVTSKKWQTIRTPTLLCCSIFWLRNNIKSGPYGSAVGHSTGKQSSADCLWKLNHAYRSWPTLSFVWRPLYTGFTQTYVHSQRLVGLCYGSWSAASGGSYPPGCALWTVPFRYPDSSRTHWRFGRQFVSENSVGQEPHSARSAPWPATQFGIRT